METTFGVAGGDRRQAILAELLRRDGYSVGTYGTGQSGEETLAAAAQADVLVLPLCREDGRFSCAGGEIEAPALLELLRPGQTILAGKVPAELAEAARKAGLTLIDYLANEELAVVNAVPTAEGAIQLAMEQSPVTLWNAECLVIGYGRIGKLLASRLNGMGARVTVSARSAADRAWVRAYGWRAVETNRLSGQLGGFRFVFNTVPAPVLTRENLSELPAECLCIDLASQPGVDFAAAKDIGLHTVWAKGLPGRMAPETAAAAIRDTIYHILKERGASI